jgi:glycosyltransferase involved in cell wall biosynthesis
MNLRRTGFGFLSLFLRLLYCLRWRFEIVVGDNGHRPSSGWPCKLNRFFYKSKYIAEWWDFFGRGGQFDDLSLAKKVSKGWYDLVTELTDKRSADAVVVLSVAMKERAIAAGIDRSKIAIIPGGADVDTIKYYKDRAFRQKYGFAENAFIIGFSGMNEGEVVDQLDFLKVVNELKEQVPLQWFTTGRKLSAELKAKYSIGNELLEFGWCNYAHYSELLSCADAFLLLQQDNLCNATRWPNKLGDYLAAGRIVFTNKVGELKQLCELHPDGIIDCGTPPVNLKQHLLEAYSRKDELIKIGYQNRIIAETTLSWHHRAKQLEQLLQNLNT